jgi:predicted acylesterase/phospholipase RssA
LNDDRIISKAEQCEESYRYLQARQEIFAHYDDYKKIQNDNLLRVLAQCYYKDLELHKKFSYNRALEILQQIKNDTNQKETLCLKGAIYKRKWEYVKNLKDLYKAIEYYEKAYNDFRNEDMGYGGINASYLYEILAKEFFETDNQYSIQLSKKANMIRENIIKLFDKDSNNSNLWIQYTLAQAYLGIGDIKNITTKLNIANKLNPKDWEIFTTYKQLKLLANLKNINKLDFLNTIDHSLNKKGLALSGGGFRASFFHLGTLAKLAECNMLKDVEVISTVSGGSIVGVLYYLKLQKLLEEKYDEDISHNDYIELVSELIDEFYKIVQTDIRNSVLWHKPQKTIKFLNPFSSYSRTNKLGEIYQERFYDKYKKCMKDLIITPKDYKNKKEHFEPRFNNWRRKNKVPILVINATNLNSGHNWQFHASKMGEPSYVSDIEIDKNNHFEWVKYNSDKLKKEFKNYSIGQAVACSSAVPMLFTPIVLKNLYTGYSLSLSDGGTYDNQGFSGLLSEECDFIICSDASGQMDNQVVSHTSVLQTNIRILDIQMDRNRELLFEDMNYKKEKGILKGFYFTHLREGLKSNGIKQSNIIQKFDINNNWFQDKISKIRTDLDKFSEIEANCLMYSGYNLLDRQIDCESTKRENWIFNKVKQNIQNNSNELKKELDLAQYKCCRAIREWFMK